LYILAAGGRPVTVTIPCPHSRSESPQYLDFLRVRPSLEPVGEARAISERRVRAERRLSLVRGDAQFRLMRHIGLIPGEGLGLGRRALRTPSRG